MIRVIVPTMWNYPPFWEFVEYILDVDVVSEFVIINNAPDNTPDLEILKHPKIKIISFGKNIFVNPAWNCGAMGSKSDLLCIVNDDFIFDTKVFYKVDKFLTKDIGCLCLSERRDPLKNDPQNTGNIDIKPYDINSTDRFGYGVLFFIHKDNWIDIPSELLIFYGDNFVFDQCYYRGLQNFMIYNLFHYHAGAQTTAKVTDNGKKDNIYIEKEAIYYDRDIVPRMLKGNFNF